MTVPAHAQVAAVQAATAEYRDESDVLGQFLAERTTTEAEYQGATVRAHASALYKAYQAWCLSGGIRPETQTAFGRALGLRGFAPLKAGGGTVWRLGLRLRSDDATTVDPGEGCDGVTVVTVHSSCARESVCACPRGDSVPHQSPSPSFLKSNQDNTMLDPRTAPIARGLAPPVAIQDAVRAASILLTGSPSSAPLAPPWRASYARWRADAARAAQLLPRGTHAQRRIERAAWEILAAADAIAEAADA